MHLDTAFFQNINKPVMMFGYKPNALYAICKLVITAKEKCQYSVWEPPKYDSIRNFAKLLFLYEWKYHNCCEHKCY